MSMLNEHVEHMRFHVHILFTRFSKFKVSLFFIILISGLFLKLNEISFVFSYVDVNETTNYFYKKRF